jgi:hypothetical protein
VRHQNRVTNIEVDKQRFRLKQSLENGKTSMEGQRERPAETPSAAAIMRWYESGESAP